MENLNSINEKAFAQLASCMHCELYALRATPSNPHPLGIILISSCTNCILWWKIVDSKSSGKSHHGLYRASPLEQSLVHITTNFARSFGMDAVSDSTTGTALKGASQVSTMM